ncbi:MAG: sugar ABC transporter substrate-binding protein [Candidatus Nanopelagicales bacterium]
MHRSRMPRAALVAVAGVLALTVAACGGDGDSSNTATPSPTDSPTESPTEDPTGAPLDASIAYLSASSANTWLQASKAAMTEIGAANGVELVEFDGQFTPGEQAKQIQDVIASDQYDGIIIAGIDGAALIPDLENAIAAGLPVVVLNQVIGEQLDTVEPQFPGASANIMVPPLESGKLLGQLTLDACEGVSPCNVVYFYGLKGTPIDTAVKLGWDEVVAANPDVTVVAEAEGQYLGPDVALAAMQDVLQSTENISVVTGPDQAMVGAQLAIEDAGVSGIKIIGFGGSEVAIAAISSGAWFGDVFGAPFTEGQLAMNAMIAALRDGTVTGGVNPLLDFPNGGLVNASNVADFTPQWAG